MRPEILWRRRKVPEEGGKVPEGRKVPEEGRRVPGGRMVPGGSVLGQIGNPHRTYLYKSDGLWYRPSKLKKVSTEMKLEKVSTESPSIVKL